MDLHDFEALLQPEGQGALAAAEALEPRELDFLAHLQSLEKNWPRALARAALETAIYRGEAASKFPEAIARRLYLTREALEQATAWEVSVYRAARFRGFTRVFDLACSVGGDALHLAADRNVVGVDLDPLRLRMARENLRTAGLPADFVLADLEAPLPFSPGTGQALFCDPARRADHRRARSVADYRPPLSVVENWHAQWPALGVKISPGVDTAELSHLDCEVEFISLAGELKEAVLWFGPLQTADRRATVLPGPYTLLEDPTAISRTGPPSGFLFEPDPAVLRAGLVTTLAAQLDAVQLDESIAYLTADRSAESPFARCWEILDWMPFNLKKLRAYCRTRGIGRVTVKKRGSPITPEELIGRLRLEGPGERILVLTKYEGAPVVLVCSENVPGSAGEDG